MLKQIITITGLIVGLFKREDKSLDDALVGAIFGNRFDAPIHLGDEIKIKSTAPQSSCGTTGNIFANATMVKTPDGYTEISVTPPHFHEFVPLSADDKIVKQSFAETDPKERAFLEKQRKMLTPIKTLDTRRRWLAVDMASQIALRGTYVHHNGSITLGFI